MLMKMSRNYLLLNVFITIPFFLFSQNFSNELVRYDFLLPVGFVFDNNGRMYVWEKTGVVHLVDENGIKMPVPLLDISEEVASWGDHGLTGFALDPAFEDNKFIYVYYVADHHYLLKYGTPEYDAGVTDLHMPTIGRVTRYTLDPSDNFQTALLSSRKILLGETITDGPVFIHESHSSGSICFGTDRTLLISCGDGNTYNGSNIGGDVLGGYASQAIAEGFMTPDQDIGSYRSQYLGSYNGKILRIDPESGEGLSSNPFFDAGNPDSPASRTWALGLRNPFRINVKPASGGISPEEGSPGTIFIGDVGSNKWEELNISTDGGMNFGWPITEGCFENESFLNLATPLNYDAPNQLYGSDNCDSLYLNFRQVFKRPLSDTETPFYHPCNSEVLLDPGIPVFIETPSAISWNHSKSVNTARTLVPDFNAEGLFAPVDVLTENAPIESDTFNGFCSIGGVFYTEGPYPEAYHHAYFHADLSGWIRVLYLDDLSRIIRTDSFNTSCANIIYLAINPVDQQIWYVNIAGQIRRITYTATPPPVVFLKTDKTFGYSPLEISFDASESYSPAGFPLQFLWEFGDGTTDTTESPVHLFLETTGEQLFYPVKLTVTDTAGITATRSITIYMNNTPPEVTIEGMEDNAQFTTASSFLMNLRSKVEDNQDDPDELNYSWWVIMHHNTHTHPQIVSNKPLDDVVLSPIGCSEDTFWYKIYLEVTDKGGLKGSDELLLLPYCGEPFIDFIDLQGDTSQQGVDLFWQVGLEQELIGYEIQRSSGNHDFEKIGFVEAKNITPLGNTYTFTDILPINGFQEYRIRALRKGGAFYFSNPWSTFFSPTSGFHLFPNPFEQSIEIILHQCLGSEVSFDLHTATGQYVFSKKWNTTPPAGLHDHICLPLLPAGLYFYTIKNGSQEIIGEIVKIY